MKKKLRLLEVFGVPKEVLSMHVLGETYTETVVLTQPAELLALGTFVALSLDNSLVGSGVKDSQHFVLPDCAEEGTIPVPLK